MACHVEQASAAWESVYVIAALANGFERHVLLSCRRAQRAVVAEEGASQSLAADGYTPKIRHIKLEKSLSMVSGLYFKRSTADFGTVLVGSLSRLKVELCNATDHGVSYSLHSLD